MVREAPWPLGSGEGVGLEAGLLFGPEEQSRCFRPWRFSAPTRPSESVGVAATAAAAAAVAAAA